MALAVTIVKQSPNSITYKCVEDGAAAAVVSRDVLADLAADGALKDALTGPDAGFADAAAAQAALEQVEVSGHTRAASVATSELLVDASIAGGVVPNNFRLDLASSEAAAADTSERYVTLTAGHSVVGT